MLPQFDRGQCWYVQAYGLKACEECPWNYTGPPEICGGKAIQKAIKAGVFPSQGIDDARRAIENKGDQGQFSQ